MIMWKYCKTTGNCIYEEHKSGDYEPLPEEVIPELTGMLQNTNNEVGVIFKEGKLLFDDASHKKYINKLKNEMLLNSDWTIIRHQEEVVNGKTPTLTDTEMQELHIKRDKIRKAATIEELFQLEV